MKSRFLPSLLTALVSLQTLQAQSPVREPLPPETKPYLFRPFTTKRCVESPGRLARISPLFVSPTVRSSDGALVGIVRGSNGGLRRIRFVHTFVVTRAVPMG